MNLLNWFTIDLEPEFNYTISQDSKWIMGDFNIDKKFDYGVSDGFEFKPIPTLGISLRYYHGFRYRDERAIRDSFNNIESITKLARSSVLSAPLNYYFRKQD